MNCVSVIDFDPEMNKFGLRPQIRCESDRRDIINLFGFVKS